MLRIAPVEMTMEMLQLRSKGNIALNNRIWYKIDDGD